MDGRTLKRLREQRGWSQQELADILNPALDRKYTPATISGWEKGRRPVPEIASVFLLELGLGSGGPPPAQAQEPGADDAVQPPGDVPPDSEPPGGEKPQLFPLPAASPYDRICTELMEMIATGIGLVGAATNSENLKRDGLIIDSDKERLGKAYGKLAQTNATFRHMIDGMTTSTAWLEVALVTGGTMGKMMRSHEEVRREQRARAEAGQLSGAAEGEQQGEEFPFAA